MREGIWKLGRMDERWHKELNKEKHIPTDKNEITKRKDDDSVTISLNKDHTQING